MDCSRSSLAPGSWAGGGAALLLILLLPRRAPPKNSLAFTLLAMFTGALGGADAVRAVQQLLCAAVRILLGPVPQMLLGIAMVMVLFENERNAVQENALAFSTLGVDPTRLLVRRRPGSQHAEHSRPPGRAAAHGPGGDLHLRALARGSALGAARFFAGVREQAGKDQRRRRIRLRTGLPPRRLRDFPQRAGDGRAVARLSRRPLRAIPPGAGRRGHPQPHRGQPADPGTQFRRDSVSSRRTPHVRLVESAAADRTGAADRTDAGKLRGHARRPAPHQGISNCSPRSGRPSARGWIRTKSCARCRRNWARFSTPAISTSLSRKATRSASNWKWKKGEMLPKRSRKARQRTDRVHYSHRAAAADSLRPGEGARAPGRHLSCRRGRRSASAARPSCSAAGPPA